MPAQGSWSPWTFGHGRPDARRLAAVLAAFLMGTPAVGVPGLTAPAFPAAPTDSNRSGTDRATTSNQ